MDVDAGILPIVDRLAVDAGEHVNLVTPPDEGAGSSLHVRADSAAPGLRRILARHEQDAQGAGDDAQPVSLAALASSVIFAG